LNARGLLLGVLFTGVCTVSAWRVIYAANSDPAALESPQLHISPAAVLEGDRVSIRVTGLEPGSTATLYSQSAQPEGDRPVRFSAAATFIANDRTGDSGASVERLSRRLKSAHYEFPYQALVYPAAGHGIVGSGWRPTTLHNTGVFNDGGTPEADARAQADAWTKMLAFLGERLSTRPLHQTLRGSAQ
jgi:BAAT / Acyl-CoA thioester hydrolase C terminal